jgi:pyrroloquinoline-quinone synthase
VLPGLRFAVEAHVNLCRLRSWEETVAASLTELLAPEPISRRIQAFEAHYRWIAPEGLEYFRSRWSRKGRRRLCSRAPVPGGLACRPGAAGCSGRVQV